MDVHHNMHTHGCAHLLEVTFFSSGREFKVLFRSLGELGVAPTLEKGDKRR